MKRRGVKDTKKNRAVLDDLGITYIENAKKRKVFIKVSNGDFNIIKQLMADE